MTKARWMVVLEEDNLYESVDGQLSLVNVLPVVVLNRTQGLGAPETLTQGPDLSHVISDDGSRAFWTGLGTGDLL